MSAARSHGLLAGHRHTATQWNNASQCQPHAESSIPLLSVAVTSDFSRNLPRLLASVDFPVDHILVAVGNHDHAIVRDVIEHVQKAISEKPEMLEGRVELRELNHNPGCAGGWNLGLRAVKQGCGRWGFIVNSDIQFRSGSLSKLASHMSQHVRDSTFGIGFVGLAPDYTWSAFAITKRLIHRAGLFDENLYPICESHTSCMHIVMRMNLRTQISARSLSLRRRRG